MNVADGELETAVEMVAALRRRLVAPEDLRSRAIARAGTWQPTIRAFSQLWSDEPPAPAAEDGPLAGVPVAVKDLFDVAGRPTTGCCRAYEGSVADADAPTIARVRSAGLSIIGKTNQHELAFGGTNLYSSCGRTGNPWDPARMTGGSSGGSAAAVAAGIVPFSLGSDTGGSIRIPSSLCGAFGLKVTTGTIPIEGMLPLAPSLDTPGPLAATAADLRILYRVLAGRPVDPQVQPVPDDARGVHLGLVGGFFASPAHPEVLAGVRGVAGTFASAGASVEPVDGDGLDDERAVWRAICSQEFAAAHPTLAANLDLVLDPSIVRWYRAGAAMTADERAAAAARRAAVGRWFSERIADRDALIVPTTPYPAPLADATVVDLGPAGMVAIDRIAPGWFTSTVNLAGLPAVTLPAGRSSEGMPFGVTLVGAAGAEERLLGLASLWEAAAGYRPGRPAPRSVDP
jgi:Asp-tRNA(Asn)/Glu-tRNA(Gln) amidotransferase A subunit family amidase